MTSPGADPSGGGRPTKDAAVAAAFRLAEELTEAALSDLRAHGGLSTPKLKELIAVFGLLAARWQPEPEEPPRG